GFGVRHRILRQRLRPAVQRHGRLVGARDETVLSRIAVEAAGAAGEIDAAAEDTCVKSVLRYRRDVEAVAVAKARLEIRAADADGRDRRAHAEALAIVLADEPGYRAEAAFQQAEERVVFRFGFHVGRGIVAFGGVGCRAGVAVFLD